MEERIVDFGVSRGCMQRESVGACLESEGPKNRSGSGVGNMRPSIFARVATIQEDKKHDISHRLKGGSLLVLQMRVIRYHCQRLSHGRGPVNRIASSKRLSTRPELVGESTCVCSRACDTRVISQKGVG